MGTSRHSGALLAVLLTACSSAGTDPSSVSPTVAAAPKVVESSELIPAYTYELRGGEVMAGDAKLEAALGDRIDLIILSDINDTVRLPAFGITKPVREGKPTRVSVTLKRRGLFEVVTTTGIRVTEIEVD